MTEQAENVQHNSSFLFSNTYNFTGPIQTMNVIDVNVHPGSQTQSIEYIHDRIQLLKTLLFERAKTVYTSTAENYPFNGRAATLVPLEIAREAGCAGQFSNYGIRGNSSHETVSHNLVALENFFDEAANLAESHTRGWDNYSERENHQRIHGNIVGIIGAAGVGKTTMTKVIAREIIESGLYDIEFLFYIRFQDINFKGETTLLKFLLSSSYIEWEEKSSVDKKILKILKESCKVMIVMDGLNEVIIPKLCEAYSPAVTLSRKASAEDFIRGLYGGKLLPNAKKLLTSRPRQMYEVQRDWRPHCILNILGINETSQRKICKEICENSHEKVFECISSNPSLSSYCSIPLNCILVVQSIHKQLEQSNLVDVLGSVTEIFVSVLEMFVKSDFLSGNFKCERLPELAWKGISTLQYYFTEDEMKKAGVTSKIASAFFNIHVEAIPGAKVLDGSKKSSFIHPMLMEFLAAVKLIQTTDTDEFRQNIGLLHQSHFETVTKFLFGLFRSNTLEQLMTLEIPIQISQRDQRVSMMKEFAMTSLRHALAERTRSSTTVLLNVCACVYEMHDGGFAAEIAEILGTKLTVVGNIFPNDVAGFFYVLQTKRTNAFELCLGPCIRFIGNSFCQFFDRILDTIQKTKMILPHVDLSRNKLGDPEASAMSKCLRRIKYLNVSDCQLSSSQVEIITDHVRGLDSNLHELNFSHNCLNDDSALYIANCLHKLDKLHLSVSMFSDQGIRVLSDAISARPSMMKHFCNSGNITNEKLHLLSKCVVNIRKLVIGLRHERNSIVRGFEELCRAIEQLSKPMQKLSIRGSNIGDEGFLALSKCLNKMHNLKLACSYDNNLTSLGIRELSSAFSKLTSPMNQFVFCCPHQYLDEVKEEFSYCEKNILQIDIRHFT